MVSLIMAMDFLSIKLEASLIIREPFIKGNFSLKLVVVSTTFVEPFIVDFVD